MEREIIEQIEEQVSIRNDAELKILELENELKDILIKESGLKINNQYLDSKNDKIWISGFCLSKWSKGYSIRAVTCKVKKDGTNGLQSHCSWGYPIKEIKSI